MHTVHPRDRGQVLIIFVFAIIGLIGITALAIDGGTIYSNRRHAQNAADTASLAAAVSRNLWQKGPPAKPAGCSNFNTATGTLPACSSGIISAALNMANRNGFNNNQVTNRVDVYSPPITGTYANCSNPYAFDCHDYIQVIINTNVDTFFARAVGISQTHNRVEAVALAQWDPSTSLYGGNSLVELRPHSGPGCGNTYGGTGGGGGDVYLGGNSGLVLDGGGIFVNSDNATCALKVTNTCPPITLKNGANIQGMGGVFPGCPGVTMAHATEPYPYPPTNSPVTPIPPAVCNDPPPANLNGVWNNTDSTYHFAPGHYDSLPLDKDSTLDPGVYCVDNLIKTTNSFKFYGNGAFMYVRAGGSFNFQGGTIQLAAPGMSIDGVTPPAPVPAAALPYKGFLIYVDESANNWNNTPRKCNINAGSDTILRGVIYAPHCVVTINGGSGTVGLTAQVIAYTLDLEGGAILNFTYDANKMPSSPEINWTGLFH